MPVFGRCSFVSCNHKAFLLSNTIKDISVGNFSGIWVTMNFLYAVLEICVMKFYHSDFAKPLVKKDLVCRSCFLHSQLLLITTICHHLFHFFGNLHSDFLTNGGMKGSVMSVYSLKDYHV